MKFFSRAIIVVCIVFIAVVLLPFFVSAQTVINVSIPGPQLPSANNPCTTVINVYWFALFISGILAFGAIVWGGIKYALAAGNPSGQSEGKEWIIGALLGILLLASTYLILNVINPALVHCEIPRLSQLSFPSAGGGGAFNGFGGGSSGGGGATGSFTSSPSAACQPPASGACSPAVLQAYGGNCFDGSLSTAAGVCNVESSNNQYAKSGTDKAADGSPVSIGLFQINLSVYSIAGLNCPSAFSGMFTGHGAPPSITNRTLYNQCVAAAQDIKNNIAAACAASKGGSSYSQWGSSTKRKCGLQ